MPVLRGLVGAPGQDCCSRAGSVAWRWLAVGAWRPRSVNARAGRWEIEGSALAMLVAAARCPAHEAGGGDQPVDLAVVPPPSHDDFAASAVRPPARPADPGRRRSRGAPIISSQSRWLRRRSTTIMRHVRASPTTIQNVLKAPPRPLCRPPLRGEHSCEHPRPLHRLQGTARARRLPVPACDGRWPRWS